MAAKAKSKAKKKSTASTARKRAPRARVRMYRQGLGDCFLITLPRQSGKPYYIMIDCGVILGTKDPESVMNAVLEDIHHETKGVIDLLVITHEHWDHLSGFLQASTVFDTLKIKEIWLAWTEDDRDPLARKLGKERDKLLNALTAAGARMRASGQESPAFALLDFFGAKGRATTRDALKAVKAKCNDVRYCLPTDPPVSIRGTGARIYTLGPPHDEKLIKKYNPSKAHPETYGLLNAADSLMPMGDEEGYDAPFDPNFGIPFDFAKQMDFFQKHYWNEAGSDGENQKWRRVDGDWFDVASTLALHLDSATNNTSLVLAIELKDKDVLLFVADAQVGNWLSWQDLSWDVGGKTITGPDLLGRTILYKTGHHGSLNATLSKDGLELMKNLQTVLVPVDHEMAVKKKWNKMPLPELMHELGTRAKLGVLRIDDDAIPPKLKNRVKQDPNKTLFYEVTV